MTSGHFVQGQYKHQGEMVWPSHMSSTSIFQGHDLEVKGHLMNSCLVEDQLLRWTINNMLPALLMQNYKHIIVSPLLMPRPYLLPGMMSPGEIQQLWKEVASQSGLDDSLMKNNVNGAVSSSLSSGLTSLPTPPTSWTSNGIAENYLSPGRQAIRSFHYVVCDWWCHCGQMFKLKHLYSEISHFHGVKIFHGLER